MPLLSYDEALAELLAIVPVLPPERLPLGEALGRCLREPITADRPQPPFNRSAMDGFALAADGAGEGEGEGEGKGAGGESGASRDLPVVGRLPAGTDPETVEPVPPGAAIRIATGAALPASVDAVVPVEKAETRSIDGTEHVRFTEPPARWANVHRRGADAAAGAELAGPGARFGAQHAGLATSVGSVRPAVGPRPRVVLLTTGDEIRPPETAADALAPHQVRNSNGPMVEAILAQAGACVLRHEHVGDEAETTLEAARRALEGTDLVVTVGGVSVGERDRLPASWEALGLAPRVRGVAIKPGKPVFIAGDMQQRVLGLPGNPVSALVTALLFAVPALRKMQGYEAPGPHFTEAILSAPARPSAGRELFRPGVTGPDHRVATLPWQGSGDLAHTGAATGLVRLPTSEDPLEPGTAVAFLAFEGAGA